MNAPNDVPPRPASTLDALVPLETARKAELVGVAKAQLPADRLVALSVLAGAFISLGALFSTVVTAGPGLAPGMSRLLGGIVFSLGLILVVVGGAELFTGNTLVVMAFASHRIRLRALVRNWAIVYLGNLAGAIATAVLVVWSGRFKAGDGSIGVRALSIAEAKSSLGFFEAVVSGVLANALVCLAVWLSFSARSVADKILAIVPPIAAFVAAGFEHSVANMYFIPAALLHRAWASDSFWTNAKVTKEAFPHLGWRRFIVDNLVPVTIGNMIGGAVLVGLVYWFVYLRQSDS